MDSPDPDKVQVCVSLVYKVGSVVENGYFQE